MQSHAVSDSVADFSHAIACDVKVRGRVSCLRCGARARGRRSFLHESNQRARHRVELRFIKFSLIPRHRVCAQPNA